MSIYGIAIVDDEYGLSLNGKIPFTNKVDLGVFKRLTTDQIVLISRNALESIPNKLPGRKKLVITRDTSYVSPYSDTITFYSVDEAIDFYARKLELTDTYRDLFILGGPRVYELSLSYMNGFYLTEVDGVFGCDTFLPDNIVKEIELLEPSTRVSNMKSDNYTMDFCFYDL